MNKRYYPIKLIMFFMCFVITSQAQVKYGLKTGLNFSTLSQSIYNKDTKVRIGYHIGLSIDRLLKDKLGVTKESFDE